jgi:uncharacterized protein YehS (DUF1456 family)
MPRKHVKKNVKKKYSDQDLQLALEATANGCSIRKAANDNHVPYTTLNSHVNNNVVFDKVGRPTRFSNEEETYLKEAALALQVKNSFYSVLICLLIFLKKELGCAIIHRGVFKSFKTIC